MTQPNLTEMVAASAARRFWAKVDRRGPDECWPWTAGLTTGGYGSLNLGGKSTRAHRAAYLLTKGEIGPGLCVCHTCDNRACCNPAHLWLGTLADNNRDKTDKGRNVRPPRDESRVRYRRGSGSGKAKLTETDVLRIRQRRDETEVAIASDYGVHPTLVGQIRRRKIWTHI